MSKGYRVSGNELIPLSGKGGNILRGDSGQWKQDQILQDDEVEIGYEVQSNGGWFKVTPFVYEQYLGDAYKRVVAFPKPKPIASLFKEAMEDYVHNRYPIDETYTATGEEKQYLKRQAAFNTGWWAFNYLLTNKMIK